MSGFAATLDDCSFSAVNEFKLDSQSGVEQRGWADLL